jgi:hypothetical protein
LGWYPCHPLSYYKSFLLNFSNFIE